ncbi:MAG TPA: hypothetical protein VHC47_06895 [Mucilaginibacter sp.]|nr:hypothetical protein [Mucilaginibacter sp.]
MEQVNIKHLTHSGNDWLKALEFYEEDLKVLQKTLEDIAADNTGHEVSEGIEYFQDQFIIHREKIDELKHLISDNEWDIGSEAQDSAGFVDEGLVEQNNSLYDQYQTEEKMINELRHQFNEFAAKWM